MRKNNQLPPLKFKCDLQRFDKSVLNNRWSLYDYFKTDVLYTQLYEDLYDALMKETLKDIIKENHRKMNELNIRHSRYTYKAKKADTDEWVYGNYVFELPDGNEHHYILNTNNAKFDAKFIPLIPINKDTLCQCTGLFTVTGYPLYEHDIVVDKYDRVFEIVRECDVVGGNKTVTAFILRGMVEYMKDTYIAIEDVLNDNGDIELSVIKSNC
jgi:hypothetical protein